MSATLRLTPRSTGRRRLRRCLPQASDLLSADSCRQRAEQGVGVQSRAIDNAPPSSEEPTTNTLTLNARLIAATIAAATTPGLFDTVVDLGEPQRS